MTQSRRNFLRESVCGLTAAAMVSCLDRLNLVNSMIPYDNYFAIGGYDSVRTGSGLAVPQAALLKITPSNSAGVAFGLHPNLSPEVANPTQTFKGLLDVWNTGQLAVLC